MSLLLEPNQQAADFDMLQRRRPAVLGHRLPIIFQAGKVHNSNGDFSVRSIRQRVVLLVDSGLQG